MTDTDTDPAFDTEALTVWEDLQLFRVQYRKSFQLLAAHSWNEARQELARVWPERSLNGARVWSHAGPANEWNLQGWREQIINPI